MAARQHLPTELLIAICELTSQPDLSRMSLVSHRLRAIVEPILYRDVAISDPQYAPRCEFAPLRLFVRTIVLRPELGALVKRLHIATLETWNPEEDDMADEAVLNLELDEHTCESIYTSALFAVSAIEDMRLLIDTAATNGLPNGLLMHSNGGCSGQVLLLFRYLSDLRELSLRGDGSDMVDILAHAASGALTGGIPVALQTLRKLELHHHDTGVIRIIEAHVLIPFMALPALTTLHVHRLGSALFPRSRLYGNENVSHVDNYNNLVGRSPVTKLSILDAVTSDDVICDVVRLTRHLEAFEYTREQAYTWVDRQVPYPLKQIVVGLLPHIHSLKTLVLADKNNVQPDTLENPNAILDEIAQFDALVHLRLPVAALLGFPPESPLSTSAEGKPLHTLRLPTTLIHLELALDGLTRQSVPWILDAFLGVTGLPHSLIHSKPKYPDLRRIIICERPPQQTTRSASPSKFGDGEIFAGVKIQVIHD